ENAIDQAKISVVEAGLQAAHRSGADDARRLADIDAGKARGTLKKRVRRDADAGTDHATQIRALGGDAIKGGRSAEIHDHARTAVFFKCSDAVHNAVRPPLSRVFVLHRHARFHTGLDKQRFQTEIALAHLAQCGIERRYDRRDHDAVDAGNFKIVHGEQAAEEHAVFVHRVSQHS